MVASPYRASIEKARAQFNGEVADHTMTVLHDTSPESPYRHVRFSAPGTGIWRFDLVTWPGHLTICGDLETFTFQRTHDMFGFFTTSHDINPSYWGEKVVAGEVKARFSAEAYEAVLRAEMDELDDHPEADQIAIRAAVESDLLADAPMYLEEAHEVLNLFAVDLPSGETFKFHDTYEWELGGYDHHFLLACHAIRYGITTYLSEYPERLIGRH